MEKKEDRREKSHRILEAARKVIARQGFQGATLEKIAAEAGLSKGALYLYFENKDALFQMALEEGLDELMAHVEREIRGVPSPLERLKVIIRSQLLFMVRRQDFLKAMVLERRGIAYIPKDRAFLRFRRKVMGYVDLVARTLKEGVARGQFRPLDVDRAAFCLIELIKGAVIARILSISRATVEEETRFLQGLILRGIQNPQVERGNGR